MERPRRWDAPFGPETTQADVRMLLSRPEFASIDAGRFPAQLPLEGILKNDARLLRFEPGDIIVREGDYGNSAFLILTGKVVVAVRLPEELLGRQTVQKKSLLEALSQLWTASPLPETRDTSRYLKTNLRAEGAQAPRVFLQDFPAVLDGRRKASMSEGALFGELAALGRVPRTATVVAETDCSLLEIRWQGLRELRNYAKDWRRQIDEAYRANALRAHLRETALFAGLGQEVLDKVAHGILFETYGGFDWHVSYKKMKKEGQAEQEPVIARQGDYPDGLLMIRAGFARVSMTLGSGERTLTYLGAGDFYGLEELHEGWRDHKSVPLRTSLRALGYVDLLRAPARDLEEHIFPAMEPPKTRLSELARRPLAEGALVEWAVQERLVNATQAMLIDLDRCTRCDDCVRACAATHGGNPRFLRHGRSFDHWLVTNACMHCADPVCMIGCPTGAIHRTISGGVVVINDDTCIGCQTCAQSCPYDNIVMVAINDQKGRPVQDPETAQPFLKATKCDLGVDQIGGPPCVRACPHDALKRVDLRSLWSRGA